MSTALAVYQPSAAALLRRRGLLLDLRRTLHGLERSYDREVERVRQFERRYRPAVGDRYDELERLREKTGRTWEALGRAREATPSGSACGEHREDAVAAAPPPGADTRQLFLALARQIHPDLAEDADERERRHEVMAEATLAYRDDDARRLQWLLEHWQAESEPILGIGLGPALRKTSRQIAWTRYRIRELQHALGLLHASPMARLLEKQEHARTAGRNLILEMRTQILRELEAAYRDYDRARAAIEELEPDVRGAVRAAVGL